MLLGHAVPPPTAMGWAIGGRQDGWDRDHDPAGGLQRRRARHRHHPAGHRDPPTRDWPGPDTGARPVGSGAQLRRPAGHRVLATPITLLVIEIPPPEIGQGQTLAHGLWAQWPSYVAYLVSFLTNAVF